MIQSPTQLLRWTLLNDQRTLIKRPSQELLAPYANHARSFAASVAAVPSPRALARHPGFSVRSVHHGDTATLSLHLTGHTAPVFWALASWGGADDAERAFTPFLNRYLGWALSDAPECARYTHAFSAPRKHQPNLCLLPSPAWDQLNLDKNEKTLLVGLIASLSFLAADFSDLHRSACLTAGDPFGEYQTR